MAETRPSFFIVGAPKCGTTALNDYLAQMPSVCMARDKESHFFGRDLTIRRRRPTLEQYLRLFDPRPGQSAVGEASVWYLYSATAAREIREFAPDARVIAMFRNPVDLLYSLHSQMLYNGNEDIADFAEALSAEADRAAGRRIPAGSHHPGSLQYRRTVRFAEQIERYLDVLGPERVHMIVFDDFRRDTPGCFRRVLDFLGVGDSVMPSFEIVNPNKRVRSRAVRAALRPNGGGGGAARALARALLPSAAMRRWGKSVLQRANTEYAERPAMAPELRRRLTEELAPEVDRLGRLIGRDLSDWTRVTS